MGIAFLDAQKVYDAMKPKDELATVSNGTTPTTKTVDQLVVSAGQIFDPGVHTKFGNSARALYDNPCLTLNRARLKRLSGRGRDGNNQNGPSVSIKYTTTLIALTRE
ncbi:hypothetical protein E4U55_001002 [Claviceps digitariae]|nr:hypothetical protein E4U55_001002 [Claviceps digitariae]